MGGKILIKLMILFHSKIKLLQVTANRKIVGHSDWIKNNKLKLLKFQFTENPINEFSYYLFDYSLIWSNQNVEASNDSELNSLLNTLTEMDGFLSNLVNYARYFISVMLGTTYIMIKPVNGMFKNPKSAILTVLIIFGAIYALYTTL